MSLKKLKELTNKLCIKETVLRLRIQKHQELLSTITHVLEEHGSSSTEEVLSLITESGLLETVNE